MPACRVTRNEMTICDQNIITYNGGLIK
jgi:hypothetical protein